MQAHELTLTQYQQQVTPLLQAYLKFAKAHRAYFAPAHYEGLLLYDFEAYVLAHPLGIKVHNEAEWADWNREQCAKQWEEKQDLAPLPVTSQVQAQHDAALAAFSAFYRAEQLVTNKWMRDYIYKDEVKGNKRAVRRAIDLGWYDEALQAGTLSYGRIIEIIASVGLKVPKSLVKKEETIRQRLRFEKNPVLAEFMQQLMDSFETERQNYFDFYRPRYEAAATKYIQGVNDDAGSVSREELREKLPRHMQYFFNYQLVFAYDAKGKLMATENQAAGLDKIVRDVIEEMGATLRYTLAAKLEMVLDELVSVEKIYLTSSPVGFEGKFLFTLREGNFTIETKAIIASGEIQREHYRYLAHYKDVTHQGRHYPLLTFEQMVAHFGKELVPRK